MSGWDFGSSARAMNQAGGNISTQADLRTVRKSTTERKSMSTKTSIKRIALVAVAALGLGVVAGIPANAARTLVGTTNVTDITMSTNRTPVAGANGNSAVHTITFVSDSTSGTLAVTPVIKLTSKPATSAMDDTRTSYDGTLASTEWEVSSSALTQTVANAAAFTVSGGTQVAQAADLTLGTANASGYLTGKLYLHANYDVAGTYVWTVFDDTQSSSDGIVNGADFAKTFTVVVSASSNTVAATGTLAIAAGGTSAVSGTYGALIKVGLKDASGNPIAPDQSAGVKVTVSGSGKVAYVNNTDVTDVSSYTLGSGDFNGSGFAYINVTDATAETVTVNVENSGFSSFTAPAGVAVSFKTITATATDALTTVLDSATNPVAASSTAYSYSGAAGTVSFKTNTAAATYDKVTVVDASAAITGYASAKYDMAVLGATTGTDKGSFSLVFATATTTSTTFSVNGSGTTVTLSQSAAAIDSVTVTSADSFRAAAGSTVSFTVRAKDQYGAALANKTITATISGRNSGVTVASAITGATGYATLSYTDASTSTSSMTDTITFTNGSKTDTASVTFTSAANLGAASVSLVTPSETTAGTVNSPVVYSAIKAGDGAEAGVVTVTATVKDAGGVVLAGVPVTFTVSGTGAAILSTTKTVYTGSAGTASASLYAWIAGTYTVTATAGTVSDTAVSSWSQENGDYSRTISVVANGASAIATVKDRFGNPVKGVVLSASRVGTGSFGGASSTTGTTRADGTVEFILTGGTGTVTVEFSSSTYGQTDALKGLVSTSTSTDVFTAYTAGDAITAEAGVGASYDAAGINSASVEVADVSTTDSVDAANEATDAANAATDAANAAAEAADAATAAAQDAQAAVAELATKVASLIAGIKAQITTLTNLVIKIQKKVRA
jgi:hypothetical protein